MNSNYSVKNIKVLKGLEGVRKRPGMYVGDTNINGLHHLIWEILDNSIDEVLAGYCNKIEITRFINDVISIRDNGRGIPVDIHPDTNKSTIETIFTTLHAGGKFDNNAYKISGGLHGVGASVVNALSKSLIVKVYKNNYIYTQSFSKGIAISDIAKENNFTSIYLGTEVRFLYDNSIFLTPNYDFQIIKERVKELAYLNKKLTIFLKDDKENYQKTIYYENGIINYLNSLIDEEDKLLKNEIYFAKKINNPKKNKNIEFEVVFNYDINNRGNLYSFCNNIKTTQHGTHVSGFLTSILRLFNNLALSKELLPNNIKFTKEDILEGLNIIISVKHPSPQFEGQTKTKLSNIDIKKDVYQITNEELGLIFSKKEKELILLIKYLINCARGRIAAKKARNKIKNKNNFSRLILPGKLTDCSSKNVDEREIFLVEGDSAGGSAKLARDRKTQAILPLKGKILNIQKENILRALKNEEIINLKRSLGVNFNIDENYDPTNDNESENNKNLENLRYGKVIIMTDADVDGSHITILLLTLFVNVCPELIMEKKIYLAQPPLFKVKISGEKSEYLFSDYHLEEMKKKHKNKITILQRYKGLGEMNADQLWETTMDPKKRKLINITLSDFVNSKLLFEELMGSHSVASRKKFILQNYNFDIKIDI